MMVTPTNSMILLTAGNLKCPSRGKSTTHPAGVSRPFSFRQVRVQVCLLVRNSIETKQHVFTETEPHSLLGSLNIWLSFNPSWSILDYSSPHHKTRFSLMLMQVVSSTSLLSGFLLSTPDYFWFEQDSPSWSRTP